MVAGEDDTTDAYTSAYKHYMDSVAQEPVYLGYTYNEVQRWGVGLGLDLKGGMNVTLQVNMGDMLKSMAGDDFFHAGELEQDLSLFALKHLNVGRHYAESVDTVAEHVSRGVVYAVLGFACAPTCPPTSSSPGATRPRSLK